MAFSSSLWGLLIALATAFLFVFWYQPVFVGELLVRSLPIVIPGYFFFGVIAGLMLKGATTSHDRWANLMGVGLVVFSLGGVGAISAANALLDDSPPAVHRVVIVNRTTSRSRNSTTYRAGCRSWRPGGDNVEFSITQSEYNRLVIGHSEMEVTVSPGCLGVEWIVERHPVIQPRRK